MYGLAALLTSTLLISCYSIYSINKNGEAILKSRTPIKIEKMSDIFRVEDLAERTSVLSERTFSSLPKTYIVDGADSDTHHENASIVVNSGSDEFFTPQGLVSDSATAQMSLQNDVTSSDNGLNTMSLIVDAAAKITPKSDSDNESGVDQTYPYNEDKTKMSNSAGGAQIFDIEKVIPTKMSENEEEYDIEILTTTPESDSDNESGVDQIDAFVSTKEEGSDVISNSKEVEHVASSSSEEDQKDNGSTSASKEEHVASSASGEEEEERDFTSAGEEEQQQSSYISAIGNFLWGVIS